MFGLFGNRGAKAAMTPSAASAAARAGEVQLVDVREDDEWRAGHIAGALHAPLSRFAETARTLPKARPLVLYCRSGARSARALAMAPGLGLSVENHIDGGIMAWQSAGLPVVR